MQLRVMQSLKKSLPRLFTFFSHAFRVSSCIPNHSSRRNLRRDCVSAPRNVYNWFYVDRFAFDFYSLALRAHIVIICTSVYNEGNCKLLRNYHSDRAQQSWARIRDIIIARKNSRTARRIAPRSNADRMIEIRACARERGPFFQRTPIHHHSVLLNANRNRRTVSIAALADWRRSNGAPNDL